MHDKSYVLAKENTVSLFKTENKLINGSHLATYIISHTMNLSS